MPRTNGELGIYSKAVDRVQACSQMERIVQMRRQLPRQESQLELAAAAWRGVALVCVPHLHRTPCCDAITP